MSAVHSRLIVHWTGKEISQCLPPAPTEFQRIKYVRLLKSILSKGLRLSRLTEHIGGAGGAHVDPTMRLVCFTEIKLGQALSHAGRYGLLGIGFERKWILARYGSPALYVNNGALCVLVKRLSDVHRYFRNSIEDGKTHAQGCEKTIGTYKAHLASVNIAISFMKNMSRHDYRATDDDLDGEYYDEMEWRIVKLGHLQVKAGLVKKRSDNEYYVVIQPPDVKLLVFPDEQTRRYALEHCWLKKHFFAAASPALLTIGDCQNF